MNDSREIFGWAMYDWANSAFSTTVVTALLGPYLLALAESIEEPLTIFGVTVEPAAIFPFFASLSVLLQVFILPILGTIADYTHINRILFCQDCEHILHCSRQLRHCYYLGIRTSHPEQKDYQLHRFHYQNLFELQP